MQDEGGHHSQSRTPNGSAWALAALQPRCRSSPANLGRNGVRHDSRHTWQKFLPFAVERKRQKRTEKRNREEGMMGKKKVFKSC